MIRALVWCGIVAGVLALMPLWLACGLGLAAATLLLDARDELARLLTC